jgi:hypothetical protein
MAISVSCPTCGNSLKAPRQLVGKRIKCLRCNQAFTVAGAGAIDGATTASTVRRPAAVVDSAEKQPVTGAVRAAFWLGAAALALGVGAGLAGLFSVTADYSQAVAWLGILLGGSAVVLAVAREECGFTFPFAGSAVSLLSLALVALWLGAAARPDDHMGRPPGPPGGMDNGPPREGRGGPPGERGRGGPRPPRPAAERAG